MMLGPGPPPKKVNRDRDKTRTDSTRELGTGGKGSSTNTGTSSADTVIDESGAVEQDQERRSDEGWNRRRYQREDEILWGLDGPEDTSSNGRGSTYYTHRNPAVNDLHPPVVSTQPTHRSETRWMLQPPPSAKIMEGKEKASRSRSGSSSTNGSGKRAPDRSLGRKVGERLMEEKVKRGDRRGTSGSASTRSRGLSRESERSATGQPHDRQLPRLSTESAPFQDETPSKTENLCSPEITISDAPEPSTSLPPLSRTPSSTSRPLPLRPPLSTIPSMSLLPSPSKPRPPNIRPLILSTPSQSSLRALQAVDTSELNTKRVERSVSPLPEARVKLPPAGMDEESELRLPEVEMMWPGQGEGFRFPAAAEQTRG